MNVEKLVTAKKSCGKTFSGTVTEILAHGVILNISGLPFSENAFLHVSQVSGHFIENLKTQFTVGQSVTVKVRFFSEEKMQWEVSLKAVAYEDLWHSRFPRGSDAICIVKRIGDFGALVKLEDGFTSRIPKIALDHLLQGYSRCTGER